MLRRMRLPSVIALFLFCAVSAYAAITGVINGTITDPTGAVIPNATITATNDATGVKQTVVTDASGFYSFPALDVGNYTVTSAVSGFTTYSKKGIHIDANSSIRTDIALVVGAADVTTEVTANQVQVETQTTQMGEVLESSKITAVPLNGRAFTDLLALQPGVSPYTGKSEGGAGAVSGSLSAGNVSINGGREASNGYMINGGNVNDGVENGTAIVPNLDAISEFRIITNNFDAEYGNFSGGQVNVVTKNGTNQWHGSAFEFVRNTAFNAAGYQFSTPLPRALFNQNIFGGTIGGPIRRDKVFFFGDYQGTRRTTGNTTSAQSPTAADRTGDITDMNGTLPMTRPVNGPGWAATLSQRLGYAVQDGEYYGDNPAPSSAPKGTPPTPCYSNDLANPVHCVFPRNAQNQVIIPKTAWSSVPANMFQFMPTPNGVGANNLAAYNSSLSGNLVDNKEALRVDFNTRYGTLFAYYFFDEDTVKNPYAGGSSGLFPAETDGRAQLANVGLTTTFKNNSVNTFRFTYMRSATHTNNPSFQTPGPSLSSLGFVTPWDSLGAANKGGISNIYPQLGGVPQTSIDGMSFGEPTSSQAHIDNTFQWLDNYMKVIGTHTLQFGLNYHYDQINERNYYGVNGIFAFGDANETGNGFADFLIGAPSSFTQASLQLLDSRSHYAAGYFQDSWRALSKFTLNYGIRYEVSTPWYDTTNKLETIIPGQQSKVFPGAPKGWVFPGDDGVARTLAPIKWNKFAPRFGFAYAASPNTSVRGGVGLFYTNFQDESGFVEVGDAPYGLFYTSPSQPRFEAPYIDRSTSNIQLGKFPFPFPPQNVSASNPDTNVNWAALEPLSSSDAVGVNNTVPYIINHFLSVQQQIGRSTLFSISYSGNVGRHLANSMEANPGDASICLSLAQPSQVKAKSSVCKPKGESNQYTRADGTIVPGTRPLDGLAFGSNPYLLTAATGNYNSLQTSLKHSSKYWDVLVGYTWAKSLDTSSSMTDGVNPFNTGATYALSSFDVRNYVVASYHLHLPFDTWASNRVMKAIIGGWAISGVTKMASGTPVTMSDSDDYSLTGVSAADMPYYTSSGPLWGGAVDKNPRNRKPYFNSALFTSEVNQCPYKSDPTKVYLCYGAAGNAKRRFFAGPGLDHTDFGILRNFRIKERHEMQLRLEAFNAFNHAEFANPSGSVTASTFGQVTATQGAPRILEVAAKYTF